MDGRSAIKVASIKGSINCSLILQAILLVLGAVTLDGGTAFRIVCYAILAYWIAVSIIMIRRIHRLTLMDRIFICCGCPIIWVLMCAFVAVLLWHVRNS